MTNLNMIPNTPKILEIEEEEKENRAYTNKNNTIEHNSIS